MMEAVLGIDTSCYTTSCALVSRSGEVLYEARQALEVDMGERGLRQSEAVFQHIKHLPVVLNQTLDLGGRPAICAVCASEKPLDGPDSYMPVFTAGASFAKAVAGILGVPCFLSTHQRGHFAAARIGLEKLPELHLALHLSGGTTQIVQCAENRISLIGETSDISAGQLMDRVGVLLGYPFPAGAFMEKLAQGIQANGRYPAILQAGKLSFSGSEAAARRDVQEQTIPPGQIAAEIFDQIARSILKLCEYAEKQSELHDILITGGVASSLLLRDLLRKRCQQRNYSFALHFGLPVYSGDNAVGIAMIGLIYYQNIEEAEHGHCVEREGNVPKADA